MCAQFDLAWDSPFPAFFLAELRNQMIVTEGGGAQRKYIKIYLRCQQIHDATDYQ